MRRTFAVVILMILLSPVAFAETQVKTGGTLAFSRAGDISADIGGFYIGIEHAFTDKYGLSVRMRKEGKKFLGPDNGYYFYVAGTYDWKPEVVQRIHKDAFFRLRFGMEFGMPHVEHNEYVETPRVRRWSHISQSRGLLIIYPMVGISTEVPLRWKFFKKRNFFVEVGMQINFSKFGVQEVVLDPSTDLFVTTRDDNFIRPVPIIYMGLGFRY